MIALTPARKAQLDEYARRHGQDPAVALDEVLAAWLEEERQEYRETVEAIKRGYANVEAGRMHPAEMVMERLRAKDGIPR
jgi:predicted transcriptional regulator